MKDTNNTIFIVLGAILIAAVGFFAGRHTSVLGKRFMAGPVFEKRIAMGGPMMKGGMMRGGTLGYGKMGGFGEITKVDGNTITLKIDEETTKEVTLSADAVVNTMTKGSVKDLKVGQKIMIAGGGFWNSQTVIVKPE